MRYRLIKFLKYNVAKCGESEVAPKWVQLLWSILFPLHWYYARQSQVRYCIEKDTYTIRGVDFSGRFFEAFSDLSDYGVVYQIKKTKSGVITLTKITEK